MADYTAAGRYGAMPLPAVAPAAGEAVTERALPLLGAYLQAFLNTYGLTASQSVIPNMPFVRRVFTHNPSYESFHSVEQPSIYLYRTGGGEPEWIAEEYRLLRDDVTLLWVFPVSQSEVQRLRRPLVGGLVKLVDDAVERMRDPCFQILGDPDPLAPAQGSDVFFAAGVVEFKLRGWTPAALVVNDEVNRKSLTYPAVKLDFLLRERDVRSTAGFDSPYTINVKYTSAEDGSVITEAEYQYGYSTD